MNAIELVALFQWVLNIVLNCLSLFSIKFMKNAYSNKIINCFNTFRIENFEGITLPKGQL